MRQYLIAVSVLLLVVSPSLVSSQYVIEDRDITPKLLDQKTFNLQSTHFQNHTTHVMELFQSAPNYYHQVNINLTDSTENRFGVDDYYRIEISFDKKDSMFDPEPISYLHDDETSEQIMLDFSLNHPTWYDYNITLYSVLNTTVELDMDILFTTFSIPSYSYNLGETEYILSSMTTVSNITSFGSFGWVPHRTNYLLMDGNLIGAQNYDITITMEFDATTFQPEDRIRVEIAEASASVRVTEEFALQFSVGIDRIFEIEIATLSDLLQLEITKVTIDIPTDIFVDEPVLPTELPRNGWIFPIFLTLVATAISYKFSQIGLLPEEGDKEGKA